MWKNKEELMKKVIIEVAQHIEVSEWNRRECMNWVGMLSRKGFYIPCFETFYQAVLSEKRKALPY